MNVVVNGKLLSAFLDTGSSITLIGVKGVRKLGLQIDKSKQFPNLTALGGTRIKSFGMTKLAVHVGEDEVIEKWVVVVPDFYLDRDLLLGADIIFKGNLNWDKNKKEMTWGKVSYPVNQVKSKKQAVKRVRIMSTKNITD